SDFQGSLRDIRRTWRHQEQQRSCLDVLQYIVRAIFHEKTAFLPGCKNHVWGSIQKNVVYLAEMAVEIGDFVESPYFDHFAHPPPRKIANSQIRCQVKARDTF